ncbi:MAG: glycosyltransferase family 4 protein [Candidatus Aminicenantes bacterium]|nr:glycosyltransferase family 4 protein [Candidatus Aminicenantes bacterium]
MITVSFIGQKGIPVSFGGVEYHVDRLASELAKRDATVFAYVRSWYTDKKKREHNGVRLIHTPTLKTKHLDASLHSLLSSIHSIFTATDIVHYHGIGPAFFSFIPKLFGKKVVCTIHRLDWATEKWTAGARLFLKAGEFIATRIPDRTIVVSAELLAYVRKKHHATAVHISHGSESPQPAPPGLITEKHGLHGADYILFLGRLSPEKRVAWIIKAFQEAKRSGAAAGVRLVIAGGSSSTDRHVAELTELSGRDGDIIFTGYVTGREKAELLSNALIFTMPSYLEGYPIALMEAKGYGRCCLVSDIPPHCEAVEDGLDGFLFRTDDFDAYRMKLTDLLENPARAKIAGTAAREKMKALPGWDAIAEKTIAVYMELAKK